MNASLRKVLLIPLLVSIAIFAYFSREVAISFERLVDSITITPGFVAIVMAAVVLQLIGHVIRAYKMRYLLMNVKESSLRFQFRALTVGYLFNTVLPFRLGELIRTRIIAGSMNISFSLAFALVVFERSVDALMLGLAGVVFLILLTSGAPGELVQLPILLILFGVLLIAALLLLAIPDSRLRTALYAISNVFNQRIKDGFRFKAWSVIYGLQRTLNAKVVIRYIGLSAASWIVYGLSIFLLVQHFFAGGVFSEWLSATIAPYFGIAVPAGPANLGNFSENTDIVLSALHSLQGNNALFTLVAWGVLIVPSALVGLILLLFKTRETVWSRSSRDDEQTTSLYDKLDRSRDISAEMSVFLENYFAGNTLSAIVHKLEVTGDFKLLRYFKGGSDAITILVAQNGKTVVKKIIPIEFEDRLSAQYDWLAAYKNVPGIVQVFDESKSADYYTINMSYSADDVSFFEYVHNHPLIHSIKVLDGVWNTLNKHVHAKPQKPKLHAKVRDAYIEKHILGCLEKAGVVDPELLRAAIPETIIVNGREYDNLHVVLNKIKHHPQAWRDIAYYAESSKVHGDVIVDNLLVDKNTDVPLIIDPAPDGNLINGKVFDFGKNMQSLYCGYEFLLRDESTVYLRDDNHIDYADATSAQYAELCKYVRTELAPKYLTEAEQRAMLFHAAALFIRRLKHQVYYTPGNALKFYAVGVKTLNDFLAQYDETSE